MDKKKSRKLPLKEVLSNVDSQELKAYVHQYAKKDSSFEVALKAHFISRISTGDDDLKYQRVLSEIIKPRTLSNDKISQRNKKVIDVVLQDFTFQMGDLLSTGNFREAYFVIKNSLDKIAYLQNKYEWHDKNVESYRLTFVEGLDHIMAQDIAPAFRAQIEKAVKETLAKSYYIPRHDYDLIHLIEKYEILTQGERSAVAKDLLSKYLAGHDDVEMVKALLLISIPDAVSLKKVLYEVHHQNIFQALISMTAGGYKSQVKQFLEDESIDYTYNSQILYCIILHKESSFKQLEKAIKKIPLETTAQQNWNILIDQLSPTFLNGHIEKLDSWITTLPFRSQCEIYAKAEDHSRLIKLLENKNDAEWIRVYDELLISEGYAKQVGKLYYKSVSHYMEDHMGEKANSYMARISHRLLSISQGDMLQSIRQKLYDQFAHRDSLTK